MNNRNGFYDWIAAAAILLLGLIINWSGLLAPGFWWTDESRHAMHGAFIVDFLRDLPLHAPYDYVQRYFAQYPALAFNWYLPFFPMLMGLIMSAAGVSEVSAHATVIGVWLLGVIGWYAWITPRFGRFTALASSVALLSMPVVVLWSRSVMLEAPAVAMCLLSVFFFQRYLDRPTHATSLTAGLVLCATLLVKQTTLFMIPVLLTYALVNPTGRSALWRKESWWGVILVFLALVVIAVHAIKFGPAVATSGETYEGSGSAALWSWKRWGTYGESLYLGTGPFMAILAAAGLILSLYRRQSQAIALPITWLAGSYVWCTYLTGVPGNSERYAFYAMPAVAFLAAYGIHHFHDRVSWKWSWAAALFLAVGTQVSSALLTTHHYVSGYEAAAQTVYGLPNSGTILFAGKHDGNFIFHLRELDTHRQRVVLRGDKVLVSMSVHKYFGVKSHLYDAADVQKSLNDHGVRWIVVESRDLVGLKEFELLHQVLEGPGYRLVNRIPVLTKVPEFRDTDILIYENLGLVLPAEGRIRINYPYLGRSFEFTFPDARSR